MILNASDLDERLDTLKNLRHAIKNDISVIIAFSQLVKLNPQDPKATEFLTRIEDRAQMILKNVEAYLSKDSLKSD